MSPIIFIDVWKTIWIIVLWIHNSSSEHNILSGSEASSVEFESEFGPSVLDPHLNYSNIEEIAAAPRYMLKLYEEYAKDQRSTNHRQGNTVRSVNSQIGRFISLAFSF